MFFSFIFEIVKYCIVLFFMWFVFEKVFRFYKFGFKEDMIVNYMGIFFFVFRIYLLIYDVLKGLMSLVFDFRLNFVCCNYCKLVKYLEIWGGESRFVI